MRPKDQRRQVDKKVWFALLRIDKFVNLILSSYWTRFIADGSPRSQKRFVHTMDLFFKAITIQAHNRAANIIPDLEDYIVLRRDTSACKPCWAMVEYANGLDLPDEVMEHPIILSLDEAANDLISWSNVGTLMRYLVGPYAKHLLGYFVIRP